MQATTGPFFFRVMAPADLAAVERIEQGSFPTPWSKDAFYREITENNLAFYYVAGCRSEREIIVGYAGIWVILDEVHLMTIAVHPDWRGHGLGEQFLYYVFAEACLKGGQRITLEVRPSNREALALYHRTGFKAAGRRRHYYTDNGEDAVIMWRDLPG